MSDKELYLSGQQAGLMLAQHVVAFFLYDLHPELCMSINAEINKHSAEVVAELAEIAEEAP